MLPVVTVNTVRRVKSQTCYVLSITHHFLFSKPLSGEETQKKWRLSSVWRVSALFLYFTDTLWNTGAWWSLEGWSLLTVVQHRDWCNVSSLCSNPLKPQVLNCDPSRSYYTFIQTQLPCRTTLGLICICFNATLLITKSWIVILYLFCHC